MTLAFCGEVLSQTLKRKLGNVQIYLPIHDARLAMSALLVTQVLVGESLSAICISYTRH